MQNAFPTLHPRMVLRMIEVQWKGFRNQNGFNNDIIDSHTIIIEWVNPTDKLEMETRQRLQSLQV